MVSEATNITREFQFLASEASAGRLLIEDGVAERCIDICNRYASSLNSVRLTASFLVYIDSFGILDSARELGGKFYELVTGGRGSGSIDDSLAQHIEIIMQMIDMFQKAGEAYKAADGRARQAIESAGDQIFDL